MYRMQNQYSNVRFVFCGPLFCGLIPIDITHIIRAMMMSSNGTFLTVYWPFERGLHRSRVNSPHNGQWRGALMFPLICVWINAWVKTREAGDLRRYSSHYDVIVMGLCCWHRTNESFDPVAVIQHSIIWKNIKSLELVFLFTQTNDI